MASDAGPTREDDAAPELTFGRILEFDSAAEGSGESRRAGEDYDADVSAALLQPKPSEVSSGQAPTPRASRGGKFFRKKNEGVSVIWCDSSSKICGGQIGRQSLFCIRETQNCSVLAHRTNKIFITEDVRTHGLYVLGGPSTQNDQASSDLFLQASLASADQVRHYPTTSMAKEEWGKIFGLCTSSASPLSCAEAEEELSKLTSALSSKTPGKKGVQVSTLPRPKMVPIKPDPGKSEAWGLTAGKEFVEYSIDFQDTLRTSIASIQDSFRNSLEGVRDLRDTVYNVNRRLIFTEGLVGSNSEVDPGMPSTLWDSASLLKTMVDELDDLVASRAHILPDEVAGIHSSLKALQAVGAKTTTSVGLVSTQLDATRRGMLSSFKKIAGSLANFQTDIQSLATKVNAPTTVGLFPNTVPTPIPTVDMENRLSLLEARVALNLTGDQKGVRLGGLAFGSPADLEAWQNTNTPGDLPFGTFTDFFVLMARINTGHKSQTEILKNMDLAKRLVMTAGECLLLGTFENRLPSLLGKESSLLDATSTKSSYFPAIATRTHFVNDSRMGGTLVVVTDQLPNVQSQITENIRQVFQSHPQAMLLASTCLAISAQFTVDFMTFIESTDRELRLNGFPKEASWLLVTKLGSRLCDELDQQRSFMRDSELSSRSNTSTQALWAVLRTVCKMQEMQEYGLANYPSISSEYVRFLVHNSGFGKVDKLAETAKMALELAKGAKSAATAAASKADEALKKAKKG